MIILCLILIVCSEVLMQNGLQAKVIQTAELNYEEYKDIVNDKRGPQEYQTGQTEADWDSNTTVSQTLLSTTPECDCGPYTKECKMEGFYKNCICQEGYSSNSQKCEECDCGRYSKGCYFGWFGKICLCLEGYLETNGTCTNKNLTLLTTTDYPTPMSTTPECDCGRFSKKCMFDWSGKHCDCLEGYANRNGTCTRCDCGKNSRACRFNTSTYAKQCICKPDYSERFGICTECDCGRNTRGCKFNSYIKQCVCRDGYAPRGDVCEECDCGKHSKNCSFNWYGKSCDCEKGYASVNGTCLECDCGENSRRCSFSFNGSKRCTCISNYAQNNGACSALCYGPTDCTNGTICTKGEGDKHFCECPPNFKGKMCEISVLCEKIESTCRALAAVCVLKDSDAYCECPPGKKLDLQSGLCTDICTAGLCAHGTCEIVGLNYNCKCDEGYSGVHCDKVIKTKPNNSILWMVSLISVNTLICVMLFAIFCLLCCKKK